MKDANWEIPDKPYDLRDRLLNFACVIVKVVRYLHTRGPVAVALSAQVLRSGTSAGANYEEADDGSSERDVLAKRKIALRELKETRFRLMVLRRTGLPDGDSRSGDPGSHGIEAYSWPGWFGMARAN